MSSGGVVNKTLSVVASLGFHMPQRQREMNQKLQTPMWLTGDVRSLMRSVSNQKESIQLIYLYYYHARVVH